ncbi:NAD(P)H-quinone oxidoreductase [Bartonella sp. HY329]|uniref:NAD(P)H-quinone oxidoreductase n=1 Tax=unclassified Bartonella TaxID=2645622 RepID=UPI0021C6411A|nr:MULTISPECIES: NAD(P)H-quinone oxidoreductase [unclassified Bartonella]UXM94701.1 NAD(P)H-quinone oxidoreductase [Bartonella sp. HY329]UXN09024.1 NAD(P)H-quinone oxidoreductase [Bartonella sp. HY328]
MLPEKMTAIEISAFGDPSVLKPCEVPIPKPKANEILVKIHAAGVNRPDVAQRMGVYPAPDGASPLPGLEIAGEVVAMGNEAKRFKLGARVFALIAGGGYAQYATVDETMALPMADHMDYVTAAAIPETFFTVWSNVFDRGGLKNGETLLIHGGSSGIGTTAIQLGKAFGATVIITAGSKQKCDACLTLGADHAINYKEQDFVTEINRITEKKGVNLILDMVGGDYTERNYKVAAIEGRIVQIAFLNGHKATINLNDLMRKRLIHTGSTLRAREIPFKAAIARELETHVLPLLATGAIKPLIDAVFPLSKAASAHSLMEESSHIGKIVLKIIED